MLRTGLQEWIFMRHDHKIELNGGGYINYCSIPSQRVRYMEAVHVHPHSSIGQRKRQ